MNITSSVKPVLPSWVVVLLIYKSLAVVTSHHNWVWVFKSVLSQQLRIFAKGNQVSIHSFISYTYTVLLIVGSQ